MVANENRLLLKVEHIINTFSDVPVILCCCNVHSRLVKCVVHAPLHLYAVWSGRQPQIPSSLSESVANLIPVY